MATEGLIRKTAQPSAIAAVCWSYLNFAKYDDDIFLAITDRLDELLSVGEGQPLQLNGHGFLGIMAFLGKFNGGRLTALIERLIEVGFDAVKYANGAIGSCGGWFIPE
ncbi:hypothetical protein Pmar_PMAR024206 [Perkinsus marinus ATCC 50983]|uniref:Uncharacterized protein n=1 Tax=Perkinsus marinus (strain ATCC 50983 / TXsc) TaxID=423536 RepID=C5L9G4_PERM5|nr:hypothetical protein Pmar_PMAR024206 [Perkinsus marinus ATCC 50983]EER06645.1 hypothetical protein Pmar_PMAR024206 [Perkinsus marinus ATCC 50983]|eukprot:XP_002774829.1 hypothetical protein Pmar_PMAR024206 [Perkinsus marinus ATCC 50983]